jgi:hypothetical protein
MYIFLNGGWLHILDYVSNNMLTCQLGGSAADYADLKAKISVPCVRQRPACLSTRANSAISPELLRMHLQLFFWFICVII